MASGERPIRSAGDRRWGARAVVVRRGLLLTDAIAISLALAMALLLADPDGRAAGQLPRAIVAIPMGLLLFKLYGLYERDARRVSHSTVDDIPSVFHALLLAMLCLWGLLRAIGEDRPPAGGRLVFLQAATFLTLAIVFVLLGRSAARSVLHRRAPSERTLLVGSGPLASLMLRKVRGRPEYGLELVGYVDDGDSDSAGEAGGLPRLGDLTMLGAMCRKHEVERVIVALPEVNSAELADVVREASQVDVRITLLPSIGDMLGPATELDEVEGVAVLAVNPARLSRSSLLLKRALDIVVAGLGAAVLLPVLPFLALAIRLDSEGPVFFRQERLGRGGRPFLVLKLRTMVHDAEARAEALRAESAHPSWLLLERDPRITRIGALLRASSLDEVPQLWNILRGEMSLVGPRPMIPDVDRQIEGWGRRRLDLTPGMTGLWQVMGRTSISFEEMLKLDYLYVTSWSLWGDVRILLRTVGVVLSKRGAN